MTPAEQIENKRKAKSRWTPGLILRDKLNRINGYTLRLFSWFITKIRYKKIPPNLKSIDNILLFQPAHMGDLITTLPAIQAIRGRFPLAKITLIIYPGHHKILNDYSDVDEILTYVAPDFDRIGQSNSWRYLVTLLASSKFDLIVEFWADWRMLLYSACYSNASYRIDMGSYQFRAKLDRLWQKKSSCQHQVEKYIELIRPLGINGKQPISLVPLRVDLIARQNILDKLTNQGFRLGEDRLFILSPRSEWEFRNWDLFKFIELAKYLLTQYQAKVVVIGLASDTEILDEITIQAHHKCINFAGKTSLEELVALLSLADLFVGNDGGPMHIAACFDIPTVGIFGPQTPELFKPYNAKGIALYQPVACSPCSQVVCSFGGICLDKVSLEEVKAAVDRLMLHKSCIGI